MSQVALPVPSVEGPISIVRLHGGAHVFRSTVKLHSARGVSTAVKGGVRRRFIVVCERQCDTGGGR